MGIREEMYLHLSSVLSQFSTKALYGFYHFFFKCCFSLGNLGGPAAVVGGQKSGPFGQRRNLPVGLPFLLGHTVDLAKSHSCPHLTVHLQPEGNSALSYPRGQRSQIALFLICLERSRR